LLVDTVLHNTKISTRKGLIEAGIAIDKGRIVKIAKKPNLPKASAHVDLKGNLALPGLIDSHVHLRDQQLAYREDFVCGTSAAAAGGVTTVVDMPNNRPTTMSAQTLMERMQFAESRIFVNVAFTAAFPAELHEIPRIVEAGAVGFKLYLLQQIGGASIDSDEALLDAFKTVCKARAPIAVHAEDKSMVEQAQKRLMELGQGDVEAFLQAHSPEAEEKATNRAIRISKIARAPLHVCHVTSETSLKAAVKAKRNGQNVTCEVTPHHLLLTREHLRKYGRLAIVVPPLRKLSDVTYIWRQMQKGLVDTIASDHAPHSLKEKESESIWDAKPGIAGLETLLPLLLTQVNKQRLTVQQLIRLTCKRPAEIYGMKDRGSLAAGAFADVTVVDLKKEWRIDASRFRSRAKFSPFDGWRVKGAPVKTLVSGQLVMDEGVIVTKSRWGRIIGREALVKMRESESSYDDESHAYDDKSRERLRL